MDAARNNEKENYDRRSRTETIKQVHELIRNNDLTEAMRVSGEVLAEYDSAWHNSVRSGQPKVVS